MAPTSEDSEECMIAELLSAKATIVRIHPAKFWAATRNMSQPEAEVLLSAISRMAEEGDLEGLTHFDFVSISDKPDPIAA